MPRPRKRPPLTGGPSAAARRRARPAFLHAHRLVTPGTHDRPACDAAAKMLSSLQERSQISRAGVSSARVMPIQAFPPYAAAAIDGHGRRLRARFHGRHARRMTSEHDPQQSRRIGDLMPPFLSFAAWSRSLRHEHTTTSAFRRSPYIAYGDTFITIGASLIISPWHIYHFSAI